MEREDAAEEVGRLKALFPGLNHTQEDFWFDQFLRHSVPIVQRAIQRLAESCGDFVNRPLLLELLAIAASSAGTRMGAEKRKAADAAERRRRDEQAADENWQQVEQLVGGLGETALVVGLESLPPESREFVARHPRVVKGLAYEAIK